MRRDLRTARRCGLIALVAATVALPVVPLAGCGDDGADERKPRDEFSVRVGELCSEFYARAGALQRELQGLDVDASSDRRTRRRAIVLVEEIQTRSRQFVRDLRGVPPPADDARAQDAEQLIASIEQFLELQETIMGDVRAEVLTPRSERLSRQELRDVLDQLNAELIEQRALLRRLDIPECLPTED